MTKIGKPSRGVFVFVVLAAGTGLASQFEAATWWVDNANPGCSDAGAGSAASPFCTLKGGTSHAVAGDTVMVNPGTYREQATVPVSGAPGLPITYQAAAPGVLILGTLSLSDPAGWTPTSTTAWSQPYAPPSAPKQVFVDGVLLGTAADALTTTPN